MASRLEREVLRFIRRHAGRAATDAAFEALALKVFAHQFEHNAMYRKFCLLEGADPGRVKRWRDIPAMPAAGFKEFVLTSFAARKAVKIFRTSGTSGASATKASADAPLRGAHFFESLRLYEASLAAAFDKFVLPDRPSLSWHFLIMSPREAPDSSLSHMMGVLNRRHAMGRARYYVTPSAPRYDLLAKDLAAARRPAILLATAFSLKGFLDFLKAAGLRIRLKRGSRLMETGGFKGRAREVSKAELHAECAERLGLDERFCVGEYGMTELSSQFYDTALRDAVKGFRRRSFVEGPAWARVVLVDGLIRVFDLANLGSVMAVQTEDTGRRAGGGFELTGRAGASELRGCSLAYEKFIAS